MSTSDNQPAEAVENIEAIEATEAATSVKAHLDLARDIFLLYIEKDMYMNNAARATQAYKAAGAFIAEILHQRHDK